MNDANIWMAAGGVMLASPDKQDISWQPSVFASGQFVADLSQDISAALSPWRSALRALYPRAEQGVPC